MPRVNNSKLSRTTLILQLPVELYLKMVTTDQSTVFVRHRKLTRLATEKSTKVSAIGTGAALIWLSTDWPADKETATQFLDFDLQ